MKVLGKNVKGGMLLSLTVRVDGEVDRDAYRKLSFIKTCPYCGKPANPADDDYKIVVPNPLNPCIPGVNLDLGTAISKCSACGSDITGDFQCDLSGFPEVSKFLAMLREAQAERMASAKIKKGGACSGKK